MAKTGQRRTGGDCGIAAPRKAQGPAAGAPVESAVLRRYRHADRRRRYLVLSKDPDRAAGAGQAVRLGAQARGRQIFPRHPVEKVGIAVDDAPFLAVELKVERDRHGRSSSFRTNVDDWVAAGPRARLALRAGTGNRRPQALSARAPRAVGEGDAARCSTTWWSSARSATSAARRCSASPPAEPFSPWRKQAPCGSLPDGRHGGHDLSRARNSSRAPARGSMLQVPRGTRPIPSVIAGARRP